ncbi:MAG: tetratricopeptide repeat protein [Spirochaetales bacterium]|nr:tetratricopeptide repeat protein [Spirochaetales bacterium]
MNKAKIIFFVILAFFTFSCNKNKAHVGRTVEKLYQDYQPEDYVNKHFPSQLEEAFDNDLNLSKMKEDVAQMMKYYANQQLFHEYLGVLLMDKGYYESALIHFEEAIKLRPKSANLYYYYGICAGQLYQAFIIKEDRSQISDKAAYYLELAEKAYLKCIEMKPSYHNALYALGIIYSYEKNDYQKAVAVMNSAVTLMPDEFRYRRLLFFAYFSSGNYSQAVGQGNKAMSLTDSEEEKNIINGYLEEIERINMK